MDLGPQADAQIPYTLADAIDVAARDNTVLQAVVQKNCQPNDTMCTRDVENELNETVSILEMQAARSLAGIRDVVASVKGIPGRKTLVVLSAASRRVIAPVDGFTCATTRCRGVPEEAAEAGIFLLTRCT